MSLPAAWLTPTLGLNHHSSTSIVCWCLFGGLPEKNGKMCCRNMQYSPPLPPLALVALVLALGVSCFSQTSQPGCLSSSLACIWFLLPGTPRCSLEVTNGAFAANVTMPLKGPRRFKCFDKIEDVSERLLQLGRKGESCTPQVSGGFSRRNGFQYLDLFVWWLGMALFLPLQFPIKIPSNYLHCTFPAIFEQGDPGFLNVKTRDPSAILVKQFGTVFLVSRIWGISSRKSLVKEHEMDSNGCFISFVLGKTIKLLPLKRDHPRPVFFEKIIRYMFLSQWDLRHVVWYTILYMGACLNPAILVGK